MEIITYYNLASGRNQPAHETSQNFCFSLKRSKRGGQVGTNNGVLTFPLLSSFCLRALTTRCAGLLGDSHYTCDPHGTGELHTDHWEARWVAFLVGLGGERGREGEGGLFVVGMFVAL